MRPGGFFVDPLRPVGCAVVTHGHSDHARPGHCTVIATPETLDIMQARLGDAAGAVRKPLGYDETVEIGEVRVRLLPAGHVLGSAQVVMEYAGTRVIVSGDYKRRADPTCRAFEPVACDLFVTEATFGLPVFRHPPPGEEIARLLRSVALFPERCHVIGAYALGKAQRLIALLREAGWERPIYLHGALQALCDLYRRHGIDLGELRPATAGEKGTARKELMGEIVIAPPAALADRWSRRLPDPVVCHRLGLDAGQAAGAAGRDRAAAGDLRPRRLGRAAGHARRGPGPGGLGHAWPRGGAGARRHAARHSRQGAGAGRL